MADETPLWGGGTIDFAQECVPPKIEELDPPKIEVEYVRDYDTVSPFRESEYYNRDDRYDKNDDIHPVRRIVI